MSRLRGESVLYYITEGRGSPSIWETTIGAAHGGVWNVSSYRFRIYIGGALGGATSSLWLMRLYGLVEQPVHHLFTVVNW